MRLHSAKVSEIAAEMVTALTGAEAIETESGKEVRLDLESVLMQYIRDEQDVTEKAKDLVQARGLTNSEFGKMKKLVADQRGFKLGDDAVDYVLGQLVDMLMHSANVVEIFAEDHELRRFMREPLRRHLAESERLDQEVRGRLKHVSEGGSLWEVEYQRMRDDIMRRRGI